MWTIYKKQILEAILDRVPDTRSYSGRGMYGKECLGVVDSDSFEVIGDVVAALHKSGLVNGEDGFAVDDLTSFIKSANQDSMGLDTIVYWPSLEYHEEYDDEDDDEDEIDLDDEGQ